MSISEKSIQPEYLARMVEAGTPIELHVTSMTFSIEDIQRSFIKDYGAFYLFQSIAQSTGLLRVLEDSLPNYWQQIFNLACYLISSGDPFLYCEDWINNTECLAVGSMSSQRISELLRAISSDEREYFYQAWCRSEQEYLALDITSISSSNLIEDVEWGYYRDKEALP